MTELAYLPDISDAYVRTFRAKIVALPPGAVVLDRTYFYPTGGGQPSDRGTLDLSGAGAVAVVDVVKSGPAVVHRIKGSLTAARVGMEVSGTIDWDRRHRHMRLHTAQHLTSARIFARWGRRTRKATLSESRALLELDGPLPSDAVSALSDDLRAAVAAARSVSIRHIPRSEWDRAPASERSGLVPLPPQVDPVRVVQIEGLDVCPCGGTHLRSTGEIGPTTVEPPIPLGDGGSRLTLTLSGPAPSSSRE